MLAPNNRELLLDALRPDPGFVLERAVGTTFSLDLDALLMAPLAFALFDVDAGNADADPIALLATIKSYADKMAIYTDGAHICAPAKERPLMQLLESTIRVVHQPNGAFHPKLWVLRYTTPDNERRHRVLVLSRNLTFDRSWDTLLRLDEDPDGAAGENALELAGFLRELDRRAPSSVTRDVARTLARVSLAPPRGFESLRFWPLLGDGTDPMSDVGATSALVISPFVTAGRLAALAPGAKRRALVTRPDTLNQLGGRVLEPWNDVFVLRGEAAESDDNPTVLSGLHAKVHVFDTGKERRIFTGSANATTAALGENVELIVELRSTEPATRIATLLGISDREPTLRSLLVERRPEHADPVAKTIEEMEEERLEELAKVLSAQPAVARARTGDDGRWVIDFDLPVGSAELTAVDGVRARLVTAGGVWQKLGREGSSLRGVLPAGAMSRVTSLVAIEVSGDKALGVPPQSFVVVAELLDAPEDRENQLLLDLLPDAEKLMRLLFMLLADGREGTDAATAVRKAIAGVMTGETVSWAPELPLFENLVRTFSREPERLRTIKGVIEQVSSTPEGRDRFPEGFLDLWATFDAVIPAKGKR